jgi:AcrR family transcriptional regulator
MSAIAKKAGVTHGAVQHHYGSRANVFKALIDQFFEALTPLEEPKPGTTAKQQRDDFLKSSFHFYGTALPVAILLLRVNVQAEPELRETIEAEFSPLNVVRDKVWNRLFQSAGLSPREVDLMRETMIAMLRGLAVRHAYRRKIGNIDGELSIITEMVDLYIAKHGKKRP